MKATLIASLFFLSLCANARATLLVHYKLDGNLAEVAATGAEDNVLSARDSSDTIVVPNGSAFVAGVPGLGGQALVLGSTGGSNVQWAGTPDASDPDLGGLPSSTDWTLETFFQPKALPAVGNFSRLMLHWDGGDAYHFSIRNVTEPRVDIFTNYGAYQTVNGTTDLAVDTWYHGAVVNSGGTVTLYLNGLSQGSYTVTGNMVDDNNLLFFGGTISNSAFIGYMDDIRVWNEAVSAGYLTSRAAQLVPEPSSFAMLLFGSMGLWLLRRKRTS